VRYCKEVCKHWVGLWVHCESAYGVYRGILHRATRDGIILMHHMQLAAAQGADAPDPAWGLYEGAAGDSDVTPAQFFWPGPGLFLPYGGLFFVRPFPFII
jgi:hypothetical protein